MHHWHTLIKIIHILKKTITKSKKNLIDIFSKSKIFENSKPFSVHRLDKDTSGLMVIAKNDYTHLKLSDQFKSHTITRKYQALVWGVPNNQLIEGYIERHKINRKKMSFNKEEKGKFSKTTIK